MKNFALTLLCLVLVVVLLPNPADAQPHGLKLTIEPYYRANYAVGLSASWQAVPGADHYVVTQYRADTAGSATHVVNTTSLSNSSGTHVNVGAPANCYYREVTVQAVTSTGVVLASSSGSFCDIGYP